MGLRARRKGDEEEEGQEDNNNNYDDGDRNKESGGENEDNKQEEDGNGGEQQVDGDDDGHQDADDENSSESSDSPSSSEDNDDNTKFIFLGTDLIALNPSPHISPTRTPTPFRSKPEDANDIDTSPPPSHSPATRAFRALPRVARPVLRFAGYASGPSNPADASHDATSPSFPTHPPLLPPLPLSSPSPSPSSSRLFSIAPPPFSVSPPPPPSNASNVDAADDYSTTSFLAMYILLRHYHAWRIIARLTSTSHLPLSSEVRLSMTHTIDLLLACVHVQIFEIATEAVNRGSGKL